MKDIPKVCTHGVFTKHVQVLPSSDVLGSQATRIILAYFSSDITGVEKDAKTQQVKHVLDKDDSGSSSYGWGLENDFPVLGDDGKSGSVLMIFVGQQHNGQNDSLFCELVEVVKGMEGNIAFHQFTVRGLKQERE